MRVPTLRGPDTVGLPVQRIHTERVDPVVQQVRDIELEVAIVAVRVAARERVTELAPRGPPGIGLGAGAHCRDAHGAETHRQTRRSHPSLRRRCCANQKPRTLPEDGAHENPRRRSQTPRKCPGGA